MSTLKEKHFTNNL